MATKTERFEMRLDPVLLERVDAWRRKRKDLPSRPEAIRRLVEQALGKSTATRPFGRNTKDKAAELASHEIDKLGDQTATNEERAQRKRRLVKGPREFRDLPGSQTNAKK